MIDDPNHPRYWQDRRDMGMWTDDNGTEYMPLANARWGGAHFQNDAITKEVSFLDGDGQTWITREFAKNNGYQEGNWGTMACGPFAAAGATA